MIEVEIKVKILDKSELERRLTGAGFRRIQMIREEDFYFDNAAGDVKRKDEAFRVRRVTDLLSGHVDTLITYKGAKLDQNFASRRELETLVADGDVFIEIAGMLGYKTVDPAVIKVRQEFVLENTHNPNGLPVNSKAMHACMDEVENLGTFLELEVMAEEDFGREAARNRLEQMVEKLGYTMADTTARSYLGMLQDAAD